MKKRDVVIGLIILAGLAGIIFWARKPQETLEVPHIPSVEEKMEGIFNLEIPEDTEKAQLEDVSGGDASGIATRSYENGGFSHVVLADLPDPEEGFFYQGWLVRGAIEDKDFISTGKMVLVKGGYLLEFESDIDFSEYEGVVISLEKIDDKEPEKHILEGQF